MKHSIHEIFKNLNLYLLIILTLSALGFLFVVEQYYSYEKIKNLNNQKSVLLKILNQEKESNKLDILQYNAEIANLSHEMQKLYKQSQHNYIAIYILNNFEESDKDLKQLESLVGFFNTQSRNYFTYEEKSEDLQSTLTALNQTYENIASHINTISLKNIQYDNDRFNIFSKIFLASLILLIFVTFWYKIRLEKIYKDILFLYTTNVDKNASVFTQEVDAVLLRMNRKSQISDNPTMLDSITGINNNKGMLQAYSQRKGIKDSSFSSVTVLEIDNFTKSKRTYSPEFTQEILKKVAYTISLHQQATDIIARTDYNQFTLIFSRASKEKLFKDIDLVRQSIAEIKLLSPDKEYIKITVTGGFINKSNNALLDDSLRKAKELLQNARGLGQNRILQARDIPK
ncbi:MAG: GGDEF domain-containing protein [Helicobacteraceae bacterium]|nr:GGDEF domain-containing protein [Candidatus Sulfurimonas ponti]